MSPSREPIVVPQPQLVDDHRVVLVDDRHHPLRQHARKRRPGVQILAPVGEHVLGEEHLAGHQAAGGELRRVPLHHLALADRSSHLKAGQVGGPRVEAEDRQACGHRP